MGLFFDLSNDYDPSQPLEAPPLGVTATHRFVANATGVAVGSKLTSGWIDTGGGTSMTGLGGASDYPTMIQATSEELAVNFDGVDDALNINLATGEIQTIMMVVRVNAAAGASALLFDTGGIAVSRNTGNAAAMTFASGSTNMSVGFTSAAFRVLIATVDPSTPTNARIAAGSTTLSTSAAPTGTATSLFEPRFRIGRTAATGGSGGAISVADIALIPGYQDAAARETIRANMRLAYPSLLL